MKIIEQFLRGKAKEHIKCEDALVVTDAFVAVIDGVTAKNSLRVDGKTTGRIAAELIAQAITALDKNATMPQAIELFTQKIAAFYQAQNMQERAKNDVNERLAASVILYSMQRNEIWNVGDCQCLVGGQLYDFSKEVDRTIAQTRALYIESLCMQGTSAETLQAHDESRAYIEPLIRLAVSFQNATKESIFSYGVIDGFAVPNRFLTVLSLKPNTEVVLATDGYPFLKPSLAASEQALQAQLQTDPLCYQTYQSTKGILSGNCSYDDRAYLRFQIDT